MKRRKRKNLLQVRIKAISKPKHIKSISSNGIKLGVNAKMKIKRTYENDSSIVGIWINPASLIGDEARKMAKEIIELWITQGGPPGIFKLSFEFMDEEGETPEQ